MQRNRRWSAGLAKRPALVLTPLMLASTAAAVCSCSFSDDMITTIGLPSSQSAGHSDGLGSIAPPAASAAGGYRENIPMSAQQQSYLDALGAAGVHPSDEMVALTIGSYVCQARAAKQNDQAVWDFVLPLVRADVREAHISSAAPPAGEVNAATSDYIRIATEQLC
ncbi:DUF732 domain-containing protein [Mycolicibacterium cosmeticum]|uniref:DUF732 domain-containing protein n=1 Tax=Mycolicibacterium cosmeticum TaxID=258533 RepID=UPI0032046F02